MRKTNYIVNYTDDNGEPQSYKLYQFHIDDPEGEDRTLVEETRYKTDNHGARPENPAGLVRENTTLLKDRYLGFISETLLREFLEERLGSEYRVVNEEFHDYDSHVDLKIYKGEVFVTIEVRGSFPYRGLEVVIRELFDHIGWYTTGIKAREDHKDFYLRTLINQRVEDFLTSNPHTVIFAGGAERDLFDKIGRTSDFKQKGAYYRCIKPITSGRDIDEIIALIKQTLTDLVEQSGNTE